MRVAVIGSGSWGTALALQLSRSVDDVRLWSRTPSVAVAIQASRENTRYLPGVSLPAQVSCSSDLAAVLQDVDLVVAVVPSQSIRQVSLFENTNSVL